MKSHKEKKKKKSLICKLLPFTPGTRANTTDVLNGKNRTRAEGNALLDRINGQRRISGLPNRNTTDWTCQVNMDALTSYCYSTITVLRYNFVAIDG